VALSALACLGACLLVWAGTGPAVEPWWPLLPGAFLAWVGGLTLKRTGWFRTAMYLMTVLAGLTVVGGRTSAGLAAMALALWGWDLGWLVLVGGGVAGARRQLPMRVGVFKAAGTVVTAVAVAFGFSRLTTVVPFWGLVAGALVAWTGVVLLILTVRRMAGPQSDDRARAR